MNSEVSLDPTTMSSCMNSDVSEKSRRKCFHELKQNPLINPHPKNHCPFNFTHFACFDCNGQHWHVTFCVCIASTRHVRGRGWVFVCIFSFRIACELMLYRMLKTVFYHLLFMNPFYHCHNISFAFFSWSFTITLI